MTENLSYDVKEINNIDEQSSNISCESLYAEFITNTDDPVPPDHFLNEELDRSYALSIEYNMNYKVSDLTPIMEYYELDIKIQRDPADEKSKKKAKKKEELIQDIVEFEMDEANKITVDRRKCLWFYMQELKDDKFLHKYIIF